MSAQQTSSGSGEFSLAVDQLLSLLDEQPSSGHARGFILDASEIEVSQFTRELKAFSKELSRCPNAYYLQASTQLGAAASREFIGSYERYLAFLIDISLLSKNLATTRVAPDFWDEDDPNYFDPALAAGLDLHREVCRTGLFPFSGHALLLSPALESILESTIERNTSYSRRWSGPRSITTLALISGIFCTHPQFSTEGTDISTSSFGAALLRCAKVLVRRPPKHGFDALRVLFDCAGYPNHPPSKDFLRELAPEFMRLLNFIRDPEDVADYMSGTLAGTYPSIGYMQALDIFPPYLASTVSLGRSGIKNILSTPPLNDCGKAAPRKCLTPDFVCCLAMEEVNNSRKKTSTEIGDGRLKLVRHRLKEVLEHDAQRQSRAELIAGITESLSWVSAMHEKFNIKTPGTATSLVVSEVSDLAASMMADISQDGFGAEESLTPDAKVDADIRSESDGQSSTFLTF